MKINESHGLFHFQKSSGKVSALKEMLQFLRSEAPGKSLQFAYVEGETSLIPHLSLWENLHIVVGGSNWKEFISHLEVDWHPLVNLIKNPNAPASESTPWERLTVSLLKATLIKSPHIIVDMNEELHTQLNLLNFKKVLLSLSQNKKIYVASSRPELWMDSCHSSIYRDGHEFKIESVDPVRSKTFRLA